MSDSYFFDQQVPRSPSLLQERAIKEAYQTLYALVDAEREANLVFTSSGAEAVNHSVFSGYLDITRKTGKNHFLCSSLDEAPAIMAMSRLQEVGCLFQMVPATRECRVTPQAIAEMITPRTAMLSLSWANGLTGVLQPVAEIAELCRDRRILFHVDATHVLGKGEFTLQGSGADLLTFNGPLPGTGGLFMRPGVEISPMILGGSEQNGLRAGPWNLTALLELARWAKEERAAADHYSMEIARLRALFEELLTPVATPLFQEQPRVPQITSLLFRGTTGEALHYLLQKKRVYGSAGGNHLQHFFHILKACGLSPCHSGLSFAFAHSTTEEEIRSAAEIIRERTLHLQKYWESDAKRV